MESINMKQELALYNLDGKIVKVRISVKKKVSSNWFWIHNIDEKEK